jgi:hypothetical protein
MVVCVSTIWQQVSCCAGCVNLQLLVVLMLMMKEYQWGQLRGTPSAFLQTPLQLHSAAVHTAAAAAAAAHQAGCCLLD